MDDSERLADQFLGDTSGWQPTGVQPMYDRLEVRIRRGTTIDGAVVALGQDVNGVVTADVCIDGPPVP
jgi:hypothetical protein